MKFLTDKRLRYGTFSTVMLIAAVAIFFLVNLVAGELNRTFDLTPEQVFTLSEATHEFLNELDTEITLTLIAQTGRENPFLFQLLAEYAAFSNISFQQRDPATMPGFVHSIAAEAHFHGPVPHDTVFVQADGVTRAVTLGEMMAGGFNFDREITRAIHAVTQGEPILVYYVMGSGEYPLSPALLHFLHSEGIVMFPLDLTRDPVPAHAQILYIPMPERDWTYHKKNAVRDFLIDGGRAFFALDFMPFYLPNFELLLEEYGMVIGQHLLLEASGDYMFMGVPFDIIPQIMPHEITQGSINENFLHLVPMPSAIGQPEILRGSLEINTLWATTVEAFARVEMIDTLTRIPSDLPGPFDLAITVTDRIGGNVTQIVAVSTQHITSDAIAQITGPANWHFVADSIRWLYGRRPGLAIPMRRPPGVAPLIITGTQRGVATGIALGGIPLVLLIIGTGVWLRRRHA